MDWQCCCMVMSNPGVRPQEAARVACKLSLIRLSLVLRLWRSPAVVFHGLMLLGRQE